MFYPFPCSTNLRPGSPPALPWMGKPKPIPRSGVELDLHNQYCVDRTGKSSPEMSSKMTAGVQDICGFKISVNVVCSSSEIKGTGASAIAKRLETFAAQLLKRMRRIDSGGIYQKVKDREKGVRTPPWMLERAVNEARIIGGLLLHALSYDGVGSRVYVLHNLAGIAHIMEHCMRAAVAISVLKAGYHAKAFLVPSVAHEGLRINTDCCIHDCKKPMSVPNLERFEGPTRRQMSTASL
ncbi:hypothetical protein FGB62_40g27 [Gracilaria domingensis]|nr:hypothetical protein FGB62_40g27 [Gracilaria domingensis]